MIRETFIYATAQISLAATAGDVQPASITIGSDAPFECNYLTAHVIQANVLVANWAGTVQINDSSSGRTLFDRAIPIDAIAGNGQMPYPMNPPRIIKANSTLGITLTNNVATATIVVICFHGNKLHPDPVPGVGA